MKPTDIENPEYFHKVVDCQYACPAHTPVPEYIRLIGQGKYDEAFKINWISNVFPGVLGRICDRPCEPACRRSRVEEQPVAICRLKRVTADYKVTDAACLPEIPKEKNGKKIALIGGGPASLTVARDLLPLGYEIHLYDDQAKAGGFVRTQVPSFRLPEKVLDEEIDRILNLGVITHLNNYVSSLKEILDKDYDAVFVGTGAPRGRDLPNLPGRKEGDESIFIGIEWLAAVLYRHITRTAPSVLVLGGGNTAMDCCRMAKRLGGENVKVIVRSPKEDMKASPWEIEDAEDEGIPIIDNHSPLEFVVKGGRLVGMNFQRVEPKYDDDGNRKLVPIDEPPVSFPCDEVILAVGQQNAFPFIEADLGMEMTDRGLPVLDPETFQSTLPKVFFGGDSAFGPKNVITAVAHGHEAAISIDLFCQGEDLKNRPAPYTNLVTQKMGMHDWLYDSHVANDERYQVPTVDRVKSLKDRMIEVELGFSKKTGHDEASRCLNCDVQTVFDHTTCIECDSCVDICPESCINFIENGEEEELRSRLLVPADNTSQDLYVSPPLPTGRVMVKDENVCLHCGLCAERCPTSSWEMMKFTYNCAQAGKKMNKLESVNDFVIRFANINGSGSASANNLFAKAIFRLGIPVSPKNIFPSNIQGLPTWYEVRVNEHGYLGRRGGVDMTVAVNGQTLYNDYLEVKPGGYFLYDSTKELSPQFNRNDITTIGIPLTSLCNDEFKNPKLRQLLKNIIYVGSLSYLLDLDFSILTDSIEKQFAKKPKLAEPNIKALELGFDFAKEHFKDACKLSVKRLDKLGDDIIMDGNTAFAIGAVFGGASVVGWYPITPSTSVIEAFDRYSKKYRIEKETGRSTVAILQAEDEMAALGIVIGASWNGARAFTATSGPGISLMNELIGLAYYAEIPAVLLNVQRSGPSTGMPTRTQQSDLLACAYTSHGDTRNVLLFPCDPKECFDFAADALDLAERLQTPIIVMSDLDLGMNDHVSASLKWDDNRKYDRGKVLSAEELDNLKEQWGRYRDVDGDGICYRTYPGTHPTKGAYFTRGTSHNEFSAYTEDSSVYKEGMDRLLVKWETARSLVPPPRTKIRDEDYKICVVFFGTTTHSAYEAIGRFKKQGILINSLRVRAFPFDNESVDFINKHDIVCVIEQNRDAQLRTMLMTDREIPPQKLTPILNFDGMPITANYIYDKIHAVLEEKMPEILADSKGGEA